VIGLSHGVTWDESAQRPQVADQEEARAWAFGACAQYVANDTFFLREMGWTSPPAARVSGRSVPGRWHIPNCVDERVFAPPGGRDGGAAPVYGHILVRATHTTKSPCVPGRGGFARIATQTMTPI